MNGMASWHRDTYDPIPSMSASSNCCNNGLVGVAFLVSVVGCHYFNTRKAQAGTFWVGIASGFSNIASGFSCGRLPIVSRPCHVILLSSIGVGWAAVNDCGQVRNLSSVGHSIFFFSFV